MTISLEAPSQRTLVENLPKRRLDGIKDACSSLAAEVNQFSDLVEVYLSEVPLRSGATACADCERFLDWLGTRKSITEEQRDLIVDQQSRHAVEFLALQKRIAHQRFLRLVKEEKSFERASAKHLSESVYVNPVSVWATFETQTLLDGQTSVPATVLFYSTETEVLTAVLDSSKVSLLKSLEQSPLKLRTLVRQTPKAERESLLEMIADLIDLKIIVLGN